MIIKAVSLFKITFIAGLILLFLSMFVEWYSFQIYSLENELLVSWQYNIFKDWSTILSSSQLNLVLRPNDLSISLPLNIIFTGSLILSGYVILFKDMERVNPISICRPYSYVLGMTLLLNMFYVIIFPVMYLIPQELYFPFIKIIDLEQNFIYLFSIDLGYIFQVIAFMLIFPFPIYYYHITHKYDNEEENYVKSLIQEAQEPIDLDKWIAQEQLKLQNSGKNIQEEDLNILIKTFIEGES